MTQENHELINAQQFRKDVEQVAVEMTQASSLPGLVPAVRNAMRDSATFLHYLLKKLDESIGQGRLHLDISSDVMAVEAGVSHEIVLDVMSVLTSSDEEVDRFLEENLKVH